MLRPTWEYCLAPFLRSRRPQTEDRVYVSQGMLLPPPSLRDRALSSDIEVLLPPSCGFPPHLPHRKFFRRGPRSFPLEREPTISGDTFGATRLARSATIAGPSVRARGRPRTAPPRRRHVMPLAMRPLREESGALPTHYSSSATRLTLRVTIRWTFGSALTRSPPVAAPRNNPLDLRFGTHTVAACCGSAPNKCASCTGGGTRRDLQAWANARPRCKFG